MSPLFAASLFAGGKNVPFSRVPPSMDLAVIERVLLFLFLAVQAVFQNGPEFYFALFFLDFPSFLLLALSS